MFSSNNTQQTYQNQNMQQPYAMPQPQQQQYAMPQQQPFANVMAQQQQYGVQQLYPQPLQQPNSTDGCFGAISIIMPILCCGGPMLLAFIGLYCAIEGKVKNDIASLFYAGMALLALLLVFFCISCVSSWICKNPPSSALCLSAMVGMSVCRQGCSLTGRFADLT
jgi:hypothetical protein